ncbi:ABC transporter permease [Streptomyces ipomoeae]|uniref:ABC transporter permease n=2 Tax=Streptomyces ipomoeae TaxID=103232 RepID=UPI0029A4983C|nr:ABC transporter permease [Streptomyces ipomoeae]MDX2700819.1 ABC transporter permease [Streptomyces ipomoeae]
MGRRRVQTVVMVLTTVMAVTASVLAVGLLVAARAPFDRAFATQRGAHLTGEFDAVKVTAAQLAATADAPGVTASAGPFLTVSVRPRTVSHSDFVPAGVDLPPLTVAGRADPGGPVDEIDLVEGDWATRPGQIVLADGGTPLRTGARLTFPDAPGSPTLTVVGTARSVTGTADAWVTPAQAETLAAGESGLVSASGATADTASASGATAGSASAADSPPTSASPPAPYSYQMLYRFRDADTDADVAVGRAAIVAAVPEGALSGARSYVSVKQEQTANAMAFVPFLVAFGGLGLVLSVLVIGIVVSGAVGAATRRIGVLKSLGFTPAQVVRAYVGQALVPAGVGCGVGLVLGNVLSVPVLQEVGEAFVSPAASIPLWVDVVVGAGALLLVAGAAVVRGQEGTGRFYGTAQAQVGASGIAGPTTVVAYEGDSAWGAPKMVSGEWIDGAGQAVVTARFLKAAGIRVGDTVTLTEQGRRATVRIVGEAFFTEGEGMELLTSTATLTELGLGRDARPGRFHVRTESGTDASRYLDSLNRALDDAGPGAFAHANTSGHSGVIVAMDALIGMLTLMLVVVAGLGVLNTVVLDTRDRVHDLGIFKALGMTPRQTVAMVVTSVAGVGLPAGLVAVPLGIALHRAVTPLMGDAVGLTVPASDIAVYDSPLPVLLAVGGLVIAVAGALLPAGWAARAGTATALRTE